MKNIRMEGFYYGRTGKADKDEIATLVTLAGLVIVLLMIVDMIGQLFAALRTLFALY